MYLCGEEINYLRLDLTHPYENHLQRPLHTHLHDRSRFGLRTIPEPWTSAATLYT